MKRRDFISKSIVASAAGLVTPKLLQASDKTKHPSPILPILDTMRKEKLFVKFDGKLTDKLEGWKFKVSDAKGRLTYNPFEGYYPDKGGKLSSKRIKLTDKKPCQPAYYRIHFEAQAKERSYQGIDFYDKDDNLLPDNYDVIYASDRRMYDRVFYASYKVNSIEIFFQSAHGIEAWNLSVESATTQDSIDYINRVYAQIPPLNFTPPIGSTKLIPRTMEAFRTGKPWHIVMLGDSIIQDTYNSMYFAPLQQVYPKMNVSVLPSVKGSTGCWYYCIVNHFMEYVYKERPDLLMIGGISNYRIDRQPSNNEAISIVARTAREILGCEILLMTGTLSIDTRQYDEKYPEKPLPIQPWNYKQYQQVKNNGFSYFDELKAMATKDQIPLWEMMTPSYQWLYASGKPFGFYNRDMVHSGEIGKQLIGRIMFEYFIS
ncbi:MAG: hypothetical protein ACTTJK_03640 [Phocaeicola sp.]|uniref:hypothetical protein n=1 Tax=Phocaeicola sp. TaxID=2773926 RepID=UPI003FA13BBB